MESGILGPQGWPLGLQHARFGLLPGDGVHVGVGDIGFQRVPGGPVRIAPRRDVLDVLDLVPVAVVFVILLEGLLPFVRRRPIGADG